MVIVNEVSHPYIFELYIMLKLQLKKITHKAIVKKIFSSHISPYLQYTLLDLVKPMIKNLNSNTIIKSVQFTISNFDDLKVEYWGKFSQL